MTRARSSSSAPIDRRTLLRGAGFCVALPFLEAMAPSPLLSARSAHRPAESPTRLLWVYVPNGVHPPDWYPSEATPYDDAGTALPWILEPLARERKRVSIVTGLVCDKARANGDGPGDHARSAAAFLTGVQPLKTDGKVRLGVSADQAAAKLIGARTRFKSLELGTEAGQLTGTCDSGYSCAYSSNISWRSETTPSVKETNPQLLFERLFRGGEDARSATARAERDARRRSLLDFVRADAKRLEARLGREDRVRLDEYTQGVRELERRIELTGTAYVDEVPDSARPEGTPGDWSQHARLLFDLLALALRTDLTRIATVLVANEGSNRVYRDLGVAEGHHTVSHHGNDPAHQESIRKINRHHVELSIRDGNRHDHDRLPILLAGGGNGTLSPGRHVRLAEPTPLMNLHLTLLEKAGAGVEQLGDSTGLLGEL
jgi:hypothetical protein